MINYIVDEQTEGLRLDTYLADIMQDLSRTKIQKIIKNEQIKVNNIVVKPSYILKIGDNLILDEATYQHDSPIVLPENIPLEIVWEDENMAVINKPSGMLTHPTNLEYSGTLVNALLYKFDNNLSNIGGENRRGIIHRLDRNTSGLIMIAKNNDSHEFLVNEMKEKSLLKKYLAIVKGILNSDEFIIDKPIGRHPTQPHKQAIIPDGKESISQVKVIERFKDATYIEVTLITGRTHQIRVHMASIGHPVYNDTLYGFGKMKIITDEQVLQSYKLEFTKPFSQERISLEINPDEKITKVLKYLREQN